MDPINGYMELALKEIGENGDLGDAYFLGYAAGLFCLYLFMENAEGDQAENDIFDISRSDSANRYLRDLIEIYKKDRERVCH